MALLSKTFVDGSAVTWPIRLAPGLVACKMARASVAFRAGTKAANRPSQAV
jgi:hypothetical protein